MVVRKVLFVQNIYLGSHDVSTIPLLQMSFTELKVLQKGPTSIDANFLDSDKDLVVFPV